MPLNGRVRMIKNQTEQQQDYLSNFERPVTKIPSDMKTRVLFLQPREDFHRDAVSTKWKAGKRNILSIERKPKPKVESRGCSLAEKTAQRSRVPDDAHDSAKKMHARTCKGMKISRSWLQLGERTVAQVNVIRRNSPPPQKKKKNLKEER